MPEIEGVNHIALTVTDIDRSVEWYTKVLDAQVLGDQAEDTFNRIVLLVPPILIGMTKHKGAAEGDRFSEARIGLDHFAFGVPNRASLDEWAAKLDALGIEHGPIRDEYYGSTLVARDPDNIQVEWFALPG